MHWTWLTGSHLAIFSIVKNKDCKTDTKIINDILKI